MVEPALKTNPGAVLLKLGFGLSEDALDPDFSWPEERAPEEGQGSCAFCLTGFYLPSKGIACIGPASLIDPYVKVRFLRKKEKTRVHAMTTAPLFYETLEFHEMLPLTCALGLTSLCKCGTGMCSRFPPILRGALAFPIDQVPCSCFRRI